MPFMYLNKYKDQCILLKPQKLVTMNKGTFIVIVDKWNQTKTGFH